MSTRRGSRSGGRLTRLMSVVRLFSVLVAVADRKQGRSYHVAEFVSELCSEVRPERHVIGARRLEINRGRPSRSHTPSGLVTLMLFNMSPYSWWLR